MKDTVSTNASVEDAVKMQAPAVMDPRLKEQMLILMLIDSLRHDDANYCNDDDLKRSAKEDMLFNDEQSLSKQMMIIAQRMLDNKQLLDYGTLLHDEEKMHVPSTQEQEPSSSAEKSFEQLMITTTDVDKAAAIKKKNASAEKKKRYRKNKAVAKHAKKNNLILRLGGAGYLSQIMLMALSSVTTFIFTLAIIQSRVDGSLDGNASPALPPTTSRSLRHRQIDRLHDDNNAAMNSPTASAVVAEHIHTTPDLSPTTVSYSTLFNTRNAHTKSSTECVDTPNWKDAENDGCDWYQENDAEGCPTHGTFGGIMGRAMENCCFCNGGSSTLPPTNSPTLSASPSISAQPTRTCFDNPNWKDRRNNTCSDYEDFDTPGCPVYGIGDGGVLGTAGENCCYCGGGFYTLPSTSSEAVTMSPTSNLSVDLDSCIDTPNWMDKFKLGCKVYEGRDEPGCEVYGQTGGKMGMANEHCCFCGGGSRTCEDVISKCEKYYDVLGAVDGVASPLCAQAEACKCGKPSYEVKVYNSFSRVTAIGTDGLYNKCKCDFWALICYKEGGVACDYAAEYCCGDYDVKMPNRDEEESSMSYAYAKSPTCYCDFYNYAQKKYGQTLKPKALNETKEFMNPCGQLEDEWISLKDQFPDEITSREKSSLMAIYQRTNGTAWNNSFGWMNDAVPHCDWYGVSCNGGFVVGIDLRGNNLIGEFPIYSRDMKYEESSIRQSFSLYTEYGVANLLSLERLDLANNKLSGTIDYKPLYNLKALTHFDISGNDLNGRVDALLSPSISHANFSNNLFTEIYRMEPFKISPLQSLRLLDLSNNAIQANITGIPDRLPPNIELLLASNNRFRGKLETPMDKLSKLRQLDLSFNALSGPLPTFEGSYFSLRELDVSNQDTEYGFTGSIPEELWRLQFVKILNLAGNKLTGTLPPDIANLAAVERFDVSNNMLSGQIPPQIGQLEGTLNYLGLVNNTFSGRIPSQLGKLQGASVYIRDNSFENNVASPLCLCRLDSAKYFDLLDDVTSCPIERNALSYFYDSAKGAEWTNGRSWNEEYTSHCDWHGVVCDKNEQVVELDLRNNGLSGRLSSSIGNLTSLTKLDLSDNDIKGSFPTEIGLLTKLKYLRLSYNAFTGTAPEGLAALDNLQLLHLHSNRITRLPNIPALDDSEHAISTFVADCGVPSAFDEALRCENCTMCCNANEDCYPQEETNVEKWGLESYAIFAYVIEAFFTLFCCILVLCSYWLRKHRKNRRNTFPHNMSMERALRESEKYALNRIGSESVYSFFVTEKFYGWLVAFGTLGIQIGILIFFVIASEVNLNDDEIDIEFTWKCPPDSDVCSDRSDLEKAGWVIFCVLMIAFLAKDMINGSKLIYHSSSRSHPFWPRIRYFVGGWCLCSITLFALYVSIVYNKAIATSNTDIIVNAVVVLFVMDVDEYIFAALGAVNEAWIEHTERDDTIRTERRRTHTERGEIERGRMGDEKKTLELVAEMTDEIALLKQQLSDQETELRKIGKLEQMVTELQENSQTRSSNSNDKHDFVADANEISTKTSLAGENDEMIPIVDEAEIDIGHTQVHSSSSFTGREDEEDPPVA